MGSHFDQVRREVKRRRKTGEKGEKGKRERKIFSRHSNGQSLTVRELKLVHATRATRGYQN